MELLPLWKSHRFLEVTKCNFIQAGNTGRMEFHAWSDTSVILGKQCLGWYIQETNDGH